MPREVAVLRFVESTFQVIDLGANLNAAIQKIAVALALERGEIGQTGEGEIDFCDRSHRTIIFDLLHEVRCEVSGIDQAHERAFGIGVRDHCLGGNFFPGREHDACGDAILNANFNDLCCATNLCSRLPSGCSHSLRDRPCASSGKLHLADWSWVRSCAQQQNQGATGGPWSQESSEDAARCDCRPQRLGIKELGDEIGSGHRSPAQDAVHIFLAEVSYSAAGLQHSPEITATGVVDIWRRKRECLADHLADLTESRAEVGVTDGIFLRPLGDFLCCLFRVRVENERPSVRRQRNGAYLRSGQLESVLLQLHVVHDVGAQRAGVVRERGATKARMKFFGDGRTAHQSPAFEHERLEARFGEIEGGDQTVVSAADNNYIARLGHSGSLSVFEDFECRQTSGSAHDAAAGMRGRTAQIEILDGRSKCGPSGDWAQEKQLFE